MFERLTIQNFKRLTDVTLRLSRLTILVGENGAGKSSVLHALALLRYSKGTAQLITEFPFINLGPPGGLVAPAKSARIRIEATPLPRQGTEDVIHFDWGLEFDREGPRTQSIVLSLSDGQEWKSEWSRWVLSTFEPTKVEIGSIQSTVQAQYRVGFPGQSMGWGYRSESQQNQEQGNPDYLLLTNSLSTPASVIHRF